MYLNGSTPSRTAMTCIVTGVLCLSPHNPSRADIVVTGATAARVQALNEWCDHHIPAVFRPQMTVYVRQFTDAQMAAYLNEDDQDGNSNDRSGDSDDDIDGVFENDPPRITLRVPISGQPDLFTFAHEYGHFVWFDLMSDSDRKVYEVDYDRQRAAHHLVTRYASTDVEEGFAEAFSFFINEPPMLKHRDAVSYRYLVDWEVHAEHPQAGQ